MTEVAGNLSSTCIFVQETSKSQMSERLIVILGTGGTIAGTAQSANDGVGYTAAQLRVEDLLAAVPALAGQRLEAHQVAQLARILNEVKTERAQAEVDGRRTLAGFADTVSGATFDEQKAAEAAALRVRSAERLREAVVKALGQIHALLEPEQRERLAYLIRTGTLIM